MMESDGVLGSVSLVAWLIALAPIAVLVVLVVTGWVRTTVAAVVALGCAVGIAALAFGVTPTGLAVALGKGAWTGLWILLVVWTALLLHAVTQRMGLGEQGGVLRRILPSRTENILVVAWVFPSFVQGVAGFGTPIAVSAPLLLSLGVTAVRAVALPLIGYHWSVGFGSVGSSFYMGALTAGLTEDGIADFAAAASILLGVNAIVAGVLVAVVYGGWAGVKESWRLLLLAGPTMAVVQAVTVRLEPAVGSLAGGAAGLLVVVGYAVLAGRRRSLCRLGDPLPGGGFGLDEPAGARAPDSPRGRRQLLVVLLPYALLLIGVLAVLIPPLSREWARSAFTWGPSFPGTVTDDGEAVRAVTEYQPVSLFAHPGSFILAATLLALLAWTAARQWPRGSLRSLLPGWFKSARKSSWSVLLLASVATVMADSGMVRTIAVGIAEVAGDLYPWLAGGIGALGSFTTGSTTSSNALFSALQADVGRLIDVDPAYLLAAQLAGGNVGNAVAPVVMLLGLAAVDQRDKLSEVVRLVAIPAGVLLLTVCLLTAVLTS